MTRFINTVDINTILLKWKATIMHLQEFKIYLVDGHILTVFEEVLVPADQKFITALKRLLWKIFLQ